MRFILQEMEEYEMVISYLCTNGYGTQFLVRECNIWEEYPILERVSHGIARYPMDWSGSVFNVWGSNQHFGTIMSGLGNVEVL